MSRFVLKTLPGGVKFDLLAPNGQPIAASETYDTRAACLKGVESVRKCAPSAPLEDLTEENAPTLPHPKFQIFRDKTGQFRFRLKARNGKIIAVSDGYQTRAGCEHGIDSVRKNAPAAEIDETAES